MLLRVRTPAATEGFALGGRVVAIWRRAGLGLDDDPGGGFGDEVGGGTFHGHDD